MILNNSPCVYRLQSFVQLHFAQHLSVEYRPCKSLSLRRYPELQTPLRAFRLFDLHLPFCTTLLDVQN